MPFAAATVCTSIGKAMLADRLRQAPGTYTNSPKWAAMGTGATGAARTAAVADTALSAEIETRTSGTESTVTTSVASDTYQNIATITATGSRSVDEFGLFDANVVGNMGFSATLAVVTLTAGDSIQFTSKIQVS